jgi:hypothetical protein
MCVCRLYFHVLIFTLSFTHCSEDVVAWIGEPAMHDITVDQRIQVTRYGYCRCDVAVDPVTNALTLFYIPDGKEHK